MYVSTQEIAGNGPKCVRCVISQNSRRKVTQRAGYRKETQKVSAEGERSNALYCMYNTLQSGQVAKKKRCLEFAGNGPKRSDGPSSQG
jgi:hypothetical protein